MFRYQILIEYVGTDFRGWQVQKKGKTIQGLIQEKISKLLKSIYWIISRDDLRGYYRWNKINWKQKKTELSSVFSIRDWKGSKVRISLAP